MRPAGVRPSARHGSGPSFKLRSRRGGSSYPPERPFLMQPGDAPTPGSSHASRSTQRGFERFGRGRAGRRPARDEGPSRPRGDVPRARVGDLKQVSGGRGPRREPCVAEWIRTDGPGAAEGPRHVRFLRPYGARDSRLIQTHGWRRGLQSAAPPGLHARAAGGARDFSRAASRTSRAAPPPHVFTFHVFTFHVFTFHVSPLHLFTPHVSRLHAALSRPRRPPVRWRNASSFGAPRGGFHPVQFVPKHRAFGGGLSGRRRGVAG
jgi:hypothetical protein